MNLVTNSTLNDNLMNSSFIVNAQSKVNYLIYFKDIIRRYLDSNKYVYISTTTNNLTQYQAKIPAHPNLHYITDGFVPTTLPVNQQVVYIFHSKETVNKDKQHQLLEYMTSNPNVCYVYIGSHRKFMNFLILQVFRFSLMFQIPKHKWAYIGHPFNRVKSTTFKNKYLSQAKKKINTQVQFTAMDYFLWHDNLFEVTDIISFNPKLIKPKRNVHLINPFNNVNTDDGSDDDMPGNRHQSQPQQVKYIYVNSNATIDDLILPDGKVVKYSQLKAKYNNDVVEI